MALYDRKHIQDFYNAYGERETQRWESSIAEQVKLVVHRHYLEKYVKTSAQILELGAGTGVFTEMLAGRTAKLTVTDLSPVQLALNRKRAEAAGYLKCIESWVVADICDLSAFGDHSFDQVLCYGGPLSYVFERKLEALSEMKRVLRPGGLLLLSVMNLWGTVQQHLKNILGTIPPEENEKIITTGNLHPSTFAPSAHHCHLFRLEELQQDIHQAGFQLLDISASNCLSTLRKAELEALKNDSQQWKHFLDLEIRACASPGMIESGTHMIAVVKKNDPGG